MQSSARAIKQRTDLLQSFDTLTSHLNTTFTALSTALARRSSKTDHLTDSKSHRDRERAYLAILVGPSTGSARSKVIYAVDGLETKVWGVRHDVIDLEEGEEDDEQPSDSDSEDENSEEDISSEDEGSASCEDDSEEEHSDDDKLSNEAPSPPQSRSPSPPPPPSTAYLEQQQALNAADRLLSRTLAEADAEGQGMATEMCMSTPTPTVFF
jgi:hypothetical protein